MRLARRSTPARTRRRRDDAGFTLVEAIVTMLLVGVVMALISPILQGVSGALTTSSAVLQTEAQGRLALQSLSLQVSNAEQLCFPTSFSSAGYTVLILDVVSSTGSGATLAQTYQWDQWSVSTTSHAMREEESATLSSPGTSVTWQHPWVTIATGVVNNPSSGSPVPFANLPPTTGSPEELKVDLQLVGNKSGATAVTLTSQVAALNYPYASGVSCSVSPAQ